MVDKMSKFSRNFISLNSLSKVLQKNRQRQMAKSWTRWARASVAPAQPQKQGSDQTEFLTIENESLKHGLEQKDAKIKELEAVISTKDQELGKTEEMFKEYALWRGKLETIETRMKEEAEHWKQAAEKL